MQTSSESFEDPWVQRRRRIQELESFPSGSGQDKELDRLRATLKKTTAEVYASLTPWQKVQVARHPERPYTLDYIGYLMTDWVEVHGDRAYGDDAAIVGGVANFGGRSVPVIGHEKGRDTR